MVVVVMMTSMIVINVWLNGDWDQLALFCLYWVWLQIISIVYFYYRGRRDYKTSFSMVRTIRYMIIMIMIITIIIIIIDVVAVVIAAVVMDDIGTQMYLKVTLLSSVWTKMLAEQMVVRFNTATTTTTITITNCITATHELNYFYLLSFHLIILISIHDL